MLDTRHLHKLPLLRAVFPGRFFEALAQQFIHSLQAQLGLPRVLRAVEMLPSSNGPWPVRTIFWDWGVGIFILFEFCSCTGMSSVSYCGESVGTCALNSRKRSWPIAFGVA